MFALPGVAHAQAEDSAHAEALFNTAMKMQDARLYDQACPKFAESKQLAPGVGVTLHLADCYEKMGRKASAWREFREAEKLATLRHDKRADVAAAHASALEPQLNRLTITPPPGEGAPAAGTVLLDGQPVPVDDINKPLVVDPGDHTVTLTSPGQPSRTFDAHVEAGAPMTTVTLEPLPGAVLSLGASPLSLTPAAPEAAVTDDERARSSRHWLGAELMGIGLASIGVGAALTPLNKMADDPDCDPPQKQLKAWVPSIVAFSAGAVTLGTGLIVYLTGPKRKSVGVLVAPTPLPGGGGATVEGAF